MSAHASALPILSSTRLPVMAPVDGERASDTPIAVEDRRDPSGSVAVVHAFWLAGMSCDGCTIAVTGATAPTIEDLLLGRLPGVPRLILHHPILAVSAGQALMNGFEEATTGKLGAPYLVVYEGSVPDERIAEALGGFWSVLGTETVDGRLQDISTAEWLRRLAPGAAVVTAIGSCATQGGMPALPGNCTGAMSVGDFLGPEFRSASGLPVITLNGCPPTGDSFTGSIAALLRFLNGEPLSPSLQKLARAA